MSFSTFNYGTPTFEQANPVLEGAKQGSDLFQKIAAFPMTMQQQALANALKQVELKYADPMTKANLALAQEEGPYLHAQTGAIPSEIALRTSQAGLAEKQAEQIAWLMKNPGYYLGGPAGGLQFLQYLRNKGVDTSQPYGGMGGGQRTPSAPGAPNLPPTSSFSAPSSNMGGGTGIGGTTGGQQFFNDLAKNPQTLTEGILDVPSSAVGGGNAISPAQNFGTTTPPGMPLSIEAALMNRLVYDDPLDPVTKARLKIAESQSEQNIPIANAEIDRTKENARQSLPLLKTLDQADANYDASNAKGSYLGTKASSGQWYNAVGNWDAEQQVDRSASDAINILSGMPSGPSTDMARQMLQQSKFDRSLEPNAWKSTIQKLRAVGYRNLEENQAKTDALSKGNLSIQEINKRWNKYETEFPVITYNKNTKQYNFHPGNMNHGYDYIQGKVPKNVLIKDSSGGMHQGTRDSLSTVFKRDPGAQVIKSW